MKSGVSLNRSGIGATVVYCDNPSSNFATQNIIDCKNISDIEISNFLIDGGWESLSKMHAASNKYREYEKGGFLSNCSILDGSLNYKYGPVDIYNNIMRNTGNGSIILCHDGHSELMMQISGLYWL
jgi:hypothetical protein